MSRKKKKKKKLSAYGPKANKKIATVMREFEGGDLKGPSGKKIKSRDRAQAIALSEARQAGYKVPKKKSKK